MRLALLTLALAMSTSAVAHPSDGAINAVYARLASTRAAHDADGMAANFAPKALLIDARPSAAVAGAELAARIRPMAERLAAEGVTMDTDYRIERRSIVDDRLAVDAGLMRQTMRRPDGKAQATVRRFLVTLQRQVDGDWSIIADASLPADEATWAAAVKTDGLHYDG